MEGASSAAIQVLVQNLIHLVKDEYSLFRGLEEEAEQLQNTLPVIQAYLNDAEKKSISDTSVIVWLKDLEALAFEADDAMDELSYHLLRKKVNKLKSPQKKVRSFFSSIKHIASPRDMALKIKDINKKFESMSTRASVLSLQSMIVNTSVYASIETDSLTLDPIFIGRDDDVDKLVELATESENTQERKFSILAIVGMGGLGKTTLTRKVFNHPKMEARFGQSRIWVHVSQTFDPIILLKKILSELTSPTNEAVELNRQDITKKLREALKDKTYLLVLDDIWNEDLSKWEDFINSISGVTCTDGNTIIMSTRKENVASLVRPFHTHPLKGLSNEECWSIIKAKAFENGQVPSSGFEMIGRKIAERCGGLPLAANVVGGALRCKSEQQWRFISENWLSDDEGDKNILKILKLSFDYLPSPSLKKCFAYFSIFPKGRDIKKQEVIEQWMAEGFLLQSDEKKEEMESIGEKFINVLLHNSLLQFFEGDEYGNFSDYVMHDLVRDLARSCFNQDRFMIGDPNPIAKKSPKNLRTLFSSSDELSDTKFSDFESLRVLVLDSYGVEELPDSIRKLIHLRLLDISYTKIRRLPEWIGELHHLQTLRVDTGYLKKLPGTLQYLINLRHLYISSEVELPANIGRLTCLQTLTHFDVGDNKKGHGIEELGNLNNLTGRLEIRSLERVHDMEEALKANLYHKPKLSELAFKWYLNREGEAVDGESVLEGLQPHSELKKLEINGYDGKRFPSWTQKMAVRDEPQQGSSWAPLTNLIAITLEDCWECEEIPMLGHLPNLKSLSLIGLKNVRILNSPFHEITNLYVERLEGLEWLPGWLFHNNPNLRHLCIIECPKLREFPDGLHNLTSLEVLFIIDCPNLKSIMGNNNIPGGARGGGGVLRRLIIQRCRELVELPSQMIESWAPSLVSLNLSGLSSLQNLPVVIECLAKSAARLKFLTIKGVPKFMGSSVESWSCCSLTTIDIDVSMGWSMERSGSIKNTVEGMLRRCRNSLISLKIKGMIDWDWLPASIQYLVSLKVLELGSVGMQELPEWFENLSSLAELYLSSCKKLRRLPSGDAYKSLTELHTLDIRNCPELEVDSEWLNIPRIFITVDGHRIKSRSDVTVITPRVPWSSFITSCVPYRT